MAEPEDTSVDRRAFMKTAAAGAAGAASSGGAHAHGSDHDRDHQAVPSDLTFRTKALESLLVEKGLVDPGAGGRTGRRADHRHFNATVTRLR